MKKKLINVMSGQWVTITQDQRDLILQAIGLNKDIAFAFLIKEGPHTVAGGLARSPKIEELAQIFKINTLGHQGKVFIDIVGGDNSIASHQYFNSLVQTLISIDQGRNIFNVTYRVNDIVHPDSCVLVGEELSKDAAWWS